MKTIFEKWKTYEAAVVPAAAPAVQREECRRAFYAGAAGMFGLVMAATEPDDEDECEASLKALDDEVKGIANDLRVG